MLKANISSGLFAMGDAFRNSGLVAGPIATVFIGSICLYAQHELVSFPTTGATCTTCTFAYQIYPSCRPVMHEIMVDRVHLGLQW